MNIYDILIGVILLIALYRGYSKGIILQLSGIVGILAGAWLAGRFTTQICKWLEVDSSSEILVYITVVIIVMVGVIILLRGVNKALKLGGLTLPVKIMGVFASLLKYVLVLSLVQSLLIGIVDSRQGDISLEFVDDIKVSHSYRILNNVSEIAFPYISELVDMVYTP